MSKHEVIIGAGDWFEDNPERIGIYNANYIGHFEKHTSHDLPWRLACRDVQISSKKFKTQQRAADWVREHLTNQAQVSE